MRKFILIVAILFCCHFSYGQTQFSHILITNDDGIEDADRLFALAKSVKSVANRVSIIVSNFDRSGSSNYMSYGKYQSTFEVTCEYVDKENNISLYTLPGYPADCIFLGLGGFFGEDRPDLVLSGINSGPNIGPSWFGSGTVGAARTAAFLGVKAIAFSGFNDDYEPSFSVIPRWIKELISSGFIAEMEKNSYLTVGIPRLPFEKIKGVKLVERRAAYDYPESMGLKKIHGAKAHLANRTTVWVFAPSRYPMDRKIECDDSFLRKGFIVITPMTINENNSALMLRLKEKAGLIPKFIK